VSEQELLFSSALELAQLIKDKELSAVELTEAYLRQIERLQPTLNAFVEVDGERALAAAREVSADDPRPFAGVPTAIKNNRAVAGFRFTFGCKLLAQQRAGHDSWITRRLKEAGMIVVGTTTLPEYGILPTTEADLFGPTRNPWDTERTPGGSSGGAAAAVAAGMVPVAHGNDGGGSIRIPAACCGLVGLKVQRGRVSLAPEQAYSLLVVDGMLTRTVADSAALLDLIAGAEVGDAFRLEPPATPFVRQAQEAPAGLRVALCTRPPLPDAQVDPLCLDGARRAGALLEELGHKVEEVTPPWVDAAIGEAFGTLFALQVASGIHFSGLAAGREPTEQDMEPMSWAIYQLARSRTAVDYLVLENQLLARLREVAAFIASYDLLLTPALAERPLPLGTLDTHAPEPLQTFTRSGYFTPFTPIFNATGNPALTLPLFHGEDGLPLAVQLVGGFAAEGLLLAVGQQLEEAAPWRERIPALAQPSVG